MTFSKLPGIYRIVMEMLESSENTAESLSHIVRSLYKSATPYKIFFKLLEISKYYWKPSFHSLSLLNFPRILKIAKCY